MAGDADGSQSTMVPAKADFLGSKKILFLNSGINKKIKQLIFHHKLNFRGVILILVLMTSMSEVS